MWSVIVTKQKITNVISYYMSGRRWTEDELIIAFALYCQTPFGKIDQRNPAIIDVSNTIDRTPSALAMKMLNFSSLDPTILESGRAGLGNASLKDEEIWNEFHNNWEEAVDKAQQLLDTGFPEKAGEEDYSSEDIRTEVKTRRRQHFFRKSVLASYKEVCCISGLNYSKLLVASHIKPWNKDKENRLNPRNGLCLSVLYDKAFDLGLITITTDYTVKVSAQLKKEATDPFSKRNLHQVEHQKIALPEKFLPDAKFLTYHNNHIFKS